MNPSYIFVLATMALATGASDIQESTHNRVSHVQQIENPKWHKEMVLCADFSQVSQFIRSEIEPHLELVLNLLPEFYQIVLREETKLRISIASCTFFSLIAFIFLSTWFFVSRSAKKKRLDCTTQYQNELVSLNLKIKELSLQNELLVTEAVDLGSKLDRSESLLKIKEAQLVELNEKISTIDNLNQSLKDQVDTISINEQNVQFELDTLKQSNELLKIDQKESKFLLDNLKILESQLRQELSEKQTSIDKLESLLSSKPNLDCINQECAKIIAKLKNEIENLESKIEQCGQLNVSNRTELEQKESLIKSLEIKLDEKDRLLKESEMQINLLNDLRQKDAKKHFKSMSEMETKLKKLSSESEKISHLREQLKIKQERVQDLETQMVNMGKTWNTERQKYEKQTHENWINGKNLEQELKETKDKLNNLKTAYNELQTDMHSKYWYKDSLSNERKTDQQLQIDTSQNELSRPSSATSSSSGINSGISGTHMPAYYARSPFQYSFNQDYETQLRSKRYYYQLLNVMMTQSRSACSSQQPSPCANFPTSASYPNSLNNSIHQNGNQIISDNKSETNEQSNV